MTSSEWKPRFDPKFVCFHSSANLSAFCDLHFVLRARENSRVHWQTKCFLSLPLGLNSRQAANRTGGRELVLDVNIVRANRVLKPWRFARVSEPLVSVATNLS